MAESETLRDFVVRNRHLPEEEALGLVLSMPKVNAWIGADPGRRDRLTAEFRRLWEEVHPREPETPQAHLGPAAPHPIPRTPAAEAAAVAERPAPRAPPAPPAAPPAPEAPRDGPRPREAPRTRLEPPAPRPAARPAPAEPAPAEARATIVPGGRPRALLRSRKENFLCTSCGSFDIHSETDGEVVAVRCRSCKTEFQDLLTLIPVIEVGPFELFFGRGREAWIKAGAIVGVWLAAILLLWWISA